MTRSNADKQRLYRLRQKGRNGEPCPPGTTREECVAWAEGLWAKFADDLRVHEHRSSNSRK